MRLTYVSDLAKRTVLRDLANISLGPEAPMRPLLPNVRLGQSVPASGGSDVGTIWDIYSSLRDGSFVRIPDIRSIKPNSSYI